MTTQHQFQAIRKESRHTLSSGVCANLQLQCFSLVLQSVQAGAAGTICKQSLSPCTSHLGVVCVSHACPCSHVVFLSTGVLSWLVWPCSFMQIT